MQFLSMLLPPIVFKSIIIIKNKNTEKHFTYAQAKIKVFAYTTVHCVKASFSYFLLFYEVNGK